MRHRQFQILVVCTANHCRSPMAEHLLQHALDASGVAGGISVRSAGTQALDGSRMHPDVATVLTEQGVTVPYWRSRRMTAEIIASADLILTAETRHRAAVVTTHPRSVRRTFPLLQFAELSKVAIDAGLIPSQPIQLFQSITTARGLMPMRPTGSDDIADPMGHSLSTFRVCAVQISQSVDSVVHLMAKLV
jgi:protein-tyrosine phosphatase